MRVLLLTDWPRPSGGVETYLLLLADGLRAAGDEVALVTSTVGRGEAPADAFAFGPTSAAAKSVLQVWNPLGARAVRGAVRRFRPDVAVVAMFELHLSPSAVAALAPTPFVLAAAYYKPICPTGLKLLPGGSLCDVAMGEPCVANGCLGRAHWLRDRVRYARIGAAIEGAAAVVACSSYLAATLREAGIPARGSVWPVPAPTAAFRRMPAERPLALSAGRLSREKGIDVLVEAVARVRADGVDLRVRVLGDGPERGAIERQIRSRGLTDVVELAGWVPRPEVERHLAEAWVLVAPSRWAEPHGMNAIEAIIRGVPVIASATGGYADTVEDGISGLLVPNGDVEALAARLADVATGRALAGHVVPVSAVERARRRFDPAAYITEMRALLAEVAA